MSDLLRSAGNEEVAKYLEGLIQEKKKEEEGGEEKSTNEE